MLACLPLIKTGEAAGTSCAGWIIMPRSQTAESSSRYGGSDFKTSNSAWVSSDSGPAEIFPTSPDHRICWPSGRGCEQGQFVNPNKRMSQLIVRPRGLLAGGGLPAIQSRFCSDVGAGCVVALPTSEPFFVPASPSRSRRRSEVL